MFFIIKKIIKRFDDDSTIEKNSYQITGNGVVHVNRNKILRSESFQKQLKKLKGLY